MSKLLSDLQANTRTYLDESVAIDWLDSEVNYAINYAYHNLISQIMQVYEKYYETTTPFQYAMVANQQEYTIDPSFIKVTRVEINFSPNITGSNPAKAIPIRMSEQLINLSNTATANDFGDVGYYLHGPLSAQKIGFIPIPVLSDTGNTKSISVWGITLPTDLVNTTDAVNIPYVDNYAYLISLRAAAQLLSKGQQEEKYGSKYLTMYDHGVYEMKNFLRDRQEDGVKMVEDVYLENTDFGYPL